MPKNYAAENASANLEKAVELLNGQRDKPVSDLLQVAAVQASLAVAQEVYNLTEAFKAANGVTEKK
jgi:anthranilate phosphoribosyltransferase